MTILILGATGATGRLLTAQLLERGCKVKAVVRAADRLPEQVRTHPNLTIIEVAVLDLTDEQLQLHVTGCDAVASCLGHTLSFKGMYGKPRRLVADSARRICDAIKQTKPTGKVKYILMNSSGCRNHDLNETVSLLERILVFMIRCAVPPHADNEDAGNYLRTKIGQTDNAIEWAAVRPDGLIDEDAVTQYDVHPSPIRSAILNAGKTSRINVAHFMAELITNEEMWQQWRGQMPVVYNATPNAPAESGHTSR